jgi:hypothetical protein
VVVAESVSGERDSGGGGVRGAVGATSDGGGDSFLDDWIRWIRCTKGPGLKRSNQVQIHVFLG